MAMSNTSNLCNFHFHVSSLATPAALPSSSNVEEVTMAMGLSPPLSMGTFPTARWRLRWRGMMKRHHNLQW
jgi:hypothetical protein